MPRTLRATEAARRFSELLNTVRYQGESVTILRGGRAVAQVSPPPAARSMTLGRFLEAFRDLPSLGADAPQFAKDMRRIVRRQPRLPKGV